MKYTDNNALLGYFAGWSLLRGIVRALYTCSLLNILNIVAHIGVRSSSSFIRYISMDKMVC